MTAGNLEESKNALDFVDRDNRLFSTVGVHPTRCNEFEDEKYEFDYLDELIKIAKKGVQKGKVVAVGECGLDYERFKFSDKQTQLKHFDKHFKLKFDINNNNNDIYYNLNNINKQDRGGNGITNVFA